MPVPRCKSWIPAACLAGCACFSIAADSVPDRILKLRREWRAQVAKDTHKLREQYTQRLSQLEKEFLTAGDYAAANKARKERVRISGGNGGGEITAPPAPAAVTDGQPVILEASTATPGGGVKFDATRGLLDGWTAAGAMASWLLPQGLKPGGYEVELTWSCAPGAGGEFVISEEHHTLRRSVKTTAGWDVCQTEIIGTLRLLAGSRFLELTAVAVNGPGLLHLKSIRLLPAAAAK